MQGPSGGLDAQSHLECMGLLNLRGSGDKKVYVAHLQLAYAHPSIRRVSHKIPWIIWPSSGDSQRQFRCIYCAFYQSQACISVVAEPLDWWKRSFTSTLLPPENREALAKVKDSVSPRSYAFLVLLAKPY